MYDLFYSKRGLILTCAKVDVLVVPWLGAGRGGTVFGLRGGAPGLGGGAPGLGGGAANAKSTVSFDTTSDESASTFVEGATCGLLGGGFTGCVDGLGGGLTWRERGGGREGLTGFG